MLKQLFNEFRTAWAKGWREGQRANLPTAPEEGNCPDNVDEPRWCTQCGGTDALPISNSHRRCPQCGHYMRRFPAAKAHTAVHDYAPTQRVVYAMRAGGNAVLKERVVGRTVLASPSDESSEEKVARLFGPPYRG
jgi:hypothetical protein